MNEKCYLTDDLFNKVEGMSKAQILALFENASYTPSFYAGALENGISYLYTGIKPTDALLEAILNHGLGTHTLTDVELDAINANVFSILFFDVKTIAAKSDGTALYLNVVGESVSTLSSSSRVIMNYITYNKDENGVLKVGDVIIPQRRFVASNIQIPNSSLGVNLTNLLTIGKTYEFEVTDSNGENGLIINSLFKVKLTKGIHQQVLTNNGSTLYYCLINSFTSSIYLVLSNDSSNLAGTINSIYEIIE